MRGHIRKRGQNYVIVYFLDGKHHWKTIGPRLREAERALAEINAEIARGTYREPRRIKFAAFAEEWIRDYARPHVKPSTFTGYECVLRTHLVPSFGSYQLADITPALVQKFQAKKVGEKRLSPNTVAKMMVLLKEMLNHAVRWEFLRASPAQHVKTVRTTRTEMDFLTPEEVTTFLDACSPELRPFFTTAVLTGMRRGELLALQWGDVDWASATIRVRRSLYRGKFVEPKSRRSVRTIHMSPRLVAELRKHRLASVPSELDLVFCCQTGGPLDPDNVVKREFQPALRRAGMREIRFHDLRHTFASLMIHQGENVKLIQDQLGHASVQVTIDRYGHLLPGAGAAAAERLDETVFGNERTSVPRDGFVK